MQFSTLLTLLATSLPLTFTAPTTAAAAAAVDDMIKRQASAVGCPGTGVPSCVAFFDAWCPVSCNGQELNGLICTNNCLTSAETTCATCKENGAWSK